MSIVLGETFFGVGFDLGSEPWCEDDLRGAGEDFGLSQTLGAKCNLTKFLGGENGGRSGHFHLQAAFQRLNTVFHYNLTQWGWIELDCSYRLIVDVMTPLLWIGWCGA